MKTTVSKLNNNILNEYYNVFLFAYQEFDTIFTITVKIFSLNCYFLVIFNKKLKKLEFKWWRLHMIKKLTSNS